MKGLRLARQSVMAEVAARLVQGAADDWFTAVGTSMTPAIKPVQRVRVRPVRGGSR